MRECERLAAENGEFFLGGIDPYRPTSPSGDVALGLGDGGGVGTEVAHQANESLLRTHGAYGAQSGLAVLGHGVNRPGVPVGLKVEKDAHPPNSSVRPNKKHIAIARALEELREKLGRDYVMTVIARPQQGGDGLYIISGERNEERQQKILEAFNG